MPAILKKLVMVGDGCTGKSSVMRAISKNEFSREYMPTVFENFFTEITIDHKTIVKLSLWDTAGQDEYDRLRPLTYPETDVIVICFSVDSPESLRIIPEKWYPEVKHFCPDVPIILISNKSDLKNDQYTLDELRAQNQAPIDREEAEDMARKIGAIAYLEVSALTNEGIGNLFDQAAKAALAYTKQSKNKSFMFFK